MATTHNQAYYSEKIRNALSVSDPTMSLAIGTPQRKIIEAVSSTLSLASSEHSATYYTGFLDYYSGTDLDAYVEQFGFSRQEARGASGIVVVKRSNAATSLQIPYGTVFYKPATQTESDIYFSANVTSEMSAGVVSIEIPVTCTIAGSNGNVAADTVIYTNSFIEAVTITNPNPMTGGTDRETDNSLRSRFRNTLFRNMAGTKDQYLGLALANAYTTRAKLISEVNEYEEIVTVEKADFFYYRVKNNALPVGDYKFSFMLNGTENEVGFSSTAIVPVGGYLEFEYNSSPFVVWQYIYAYNANGTLLFSANANNVPTVFDTDLGYNLCSQGYCTDMLRLTDKDRIWVKRTSDDTYLNLPDEYNIVPFGSRTTQKVVYCINKITYDVGQTIGPFDSQGNSWLQKNNVEQVYLKPIIENETPYQIPYYEDFGNNKKIYLIADSAEGKMEMHDWFLSFLPQNYAVGKYSAHDFWAEIKVTSLNANSCVWFYSDGSDKMYVCVSDKDGNLDGSWNSTKGCWITSYNAEIYCITEETTVPQDNKFPQTSSFNDSPLYRVKYQYMPVEEGDFVALSMQYVTDRWRQGTNYVDEYIDGDYLVAVEDIGVLTHINKLSQAATPHLLDGSFIREDGMLPSEGNYFIYLGYQPVRHIDDSITVGAGIVLNEGEDYWIVHEVEKAKVANQDYTNLHRGSVRASDFVEINANTQKVQNITNGTPLHIGYIYNQAVEQVQNLVDSQSPVCTDNLVHETTKRRCEVCLTVMYNSYSPSTIKDTIEKAVIDWANQQAFGVTIQFSDIETIVANIQGVDNVRISTMEDVKGSLSKTVTEEFKGDGTNKTFIVKNKGIIGTPSGAVKVDDTVVPYTRKGYYFILSSAPALNATVSISYIYADPQDKFGIIEYQLDGTTYKDRHLKDFRQSCNEQFYVQNVTVHTKTQAGW